MTTVTTEKKPIFSFGPSEAAEYKEALKNARKEMVTFGNQIHEYLEHIHADVENYKFTVEKHGEGIEIELNLKAYVHPEHPDKSEAHAGAPTENVD